MAPLRQATGALRGAGPLRLGWRRFKRSRTAIVGAMITALIVVCAVGAPVLSPYNYDDQSKEDAGRGPSWRHPCGTDRVGMDCLSRVIYGARISLRVAIPATILSVFLGVVIGALAGYIGGWTDEALMRVADTFSAFPGILLAIAIAAVFNERSLAVVAMALGLVGWPGLARLVRGQVLSLKQQDFVVAANALGAGRLRVTFRHILPNCLSPVIVAGTLLIAGNILGEAGLSFLGIGAESPYPSWGQMLADHRGDLMNLWWTCAFPGAAIALTVLGFNLIGDGLRDALDPRMQGR